MVATVVLGNEFRLPLCTMQKLAGGALEVGAATGTIGNADWGINLYTGQEYLEGYENQVGSTSHTHGIFFLRVPETYVQGDTFQVRVGAIDANDQSGGTKTIDVQVDRVPLNSAVDEAQQIMTPQTQVVPNGSYNEYTYTTDGSDLPDLRPGDLISVKVSAHWGYFSAPSKVFVTNVVIIL